MAVVRGFYKLLNSHEYTQAWALVPPNVRAQTGGFQQWQAGYSSTVSSRPTDLSISNVSRDDATVSLALHATDTDACTGDDVSQVFSGTWRLRAVGNNWDPKSISFHKVSGGTPTLDAADCSPSTSGNASPGSTKPAKTTASNCDPNYEGACLDPDSPDYDCAGGTGDGPDYVQGPIQVVGDDHYGLDSDGDGTACE